MDPGTCLPRTLAQTAPRRLAGLRALSVGTAAAAAAVALLLAGCAGAQRTTGSTSAGGPASGTGDCPCAAVGGVGTLHPTERLLLQGGGASDPLPVVTNEQPGGDRFLRSVALPAPGPGPDLELLLARMQASLLAEKGVGIAAPQVGISRRAIWVRRLDIKPEEPLRAYLDPQVVWRSDETVVDWEGCLSVPAGYGQVRRAKAIRVQHRAPSGESLLEPVEGFTARIFEHEIDHLEGQLFLDIKEPGDLVDKETYRRRKKAREGAEGGSGPTAAPPGPAATQGAAGAQARPAVDHFYTDLDGTLLLEDSTVSPENLAALARYRSAGGHVGVATGRLPEHGLIAALAVRADLPLLFANGAIVLNPDGSLRSLHGLQKAQLIRDICAPVAVAGCETIYTAYADPSSGATRIVDGTCGPSERRGEVVVKIRARQCRDHERLLRTLAAGAEGAYSVMESGSGPHLGVSVAPLGVDKGTALAAVLSALGVAPSRVAFSGDSGNDVSAAAWLHAQGGRCFAMRNATLELKQACPRHTERRYDQGGVAEAVLELLGQAPPRKGQP